MIDTRMGKEPKLLTAPIWKLMSHSVLDSYWNILYAPVLSSARIQQYTTKCRPKALPVNSFYSFGLTQDSITSI